MVTDKGELVFSEGTCFNEHLGRKSGDVYGCIVYVFKGIGIERPDTTVRIFKKNLVAIFWEFTTFGWRSVASNLIVL